MLVLSRKSGEDIIIDGNIKITVIAVKGDRVRIGVDAPRSVDVDRKEVHDRRAQFVDAARATAGGLFYDDQQWHEPLKPCFAKG